MKTNSKEKAILSDFKAELLCKNSLANNVLFYPCAGDDFLTHAHSSCFRYSSRKNWKFEKLSSQWVEIIERGSKGTHIQNGCFFALAWLSRWLSIVPFQKMAATRIQVCSIWKNLGFCLWNFWKWRDSQGYVAYFSTDWIIAIGKTGDRLTSILPKLLPYLALKKKCTFAVVARVDNVLECSNFGNMPPRWAQ